MLYNKIYYFNNYILPLVIIYYHQLNTIYRRIYVTFVAKGLNISSSRIRHLIKTTRARASKTQVSNAARKTLQAQRNVILHAR